MLSLRALVRSAPRATSRLTSSISSASILRPAFQPAIRLARLPIAIQLPRSFSTTLARHDDAAQELAAKLNAEIAVESEENAARAESDDNVSAFLEQNPQWKIHDVEGEQDVRLTRSYEDETITVSFGVGDFSTPMMEGDEGEDGEESDDALLDEEDELPEAMQSGGANTKGAVPQGRTAGGNVKIAPEHPVAPADSEESRSEEDASDIEPAYPANINVLIEKKAKGALRINVIADNGVFTIQSVTHLPDSKHTAGKRAAELLRDTPDELYTGPVFQQLDEEVQSLIEQYLDVRGLNTALALFVPEYIDGKEAREYVGWLRRVRDFVE